MSDTILSGRSTVKAKREFTGEMTVRLCLILKVKQCCFEREMLGS